MSLGDQSDYEGNQPPPDVPYLGEGDDGLAGDVGEASIGDLRGEVKEGDIEKENSLRHLIAVWSMLGGGLVIGVVLLFVIGTFPSLDGALLSVQCFLDVNDGDAALHPAVLDRTLLFAAAFYLIRVLPLIVGMWCGFQLLRIGERASIPLRLAIHARALLGQGARGLDRQAVKAMRELMNMARPPDK